MRSDAIEQALHDILGDSAGPVGLVVTVRRHDEYDLLLQKIALLEDEKRRMDVDLHTMSMYAQQYLRALDELRVCSRLLLHYGEDVSFITSLKHK